MIELIDWLRANEKIVAWLGIASVVMFAGSIIVVQVVITRMSADYFMPERERTFAEGHPVLRVLGVIGKNVLGVLLVITGIVMIFVPGQGRLTILFGVVLIDCPGQRTFELWLVRRKPVLKSINWIREKAKREPLQLP
jgi:hypothetical protein